jgi:hypothetical protein
VHDLYDQFGLRSEHRPDLKGTESPSNTKALHPRLASPPMTTDDTLLPTPAAGACRERPIVGR